MYSLLDLGVTSFCHLLGQSLACFLTKSDLHWPQVAVP